MTRCMGLDLSLTGTGIAVMTPGRVEYTELVETRPEDGGVVLRADHIAYRIEHVYHCYQPNLIVIEDYAYSRPTNLSKLGELGGIVKHRLWRASGVPDCWMLAISTQVKLFVTGNGKASKEDMIEAVSPLMQDQPAAWAEDDNVCDAVGCAMWGMATYPQTS